MVPACWNLRAATAAMPHAQVRECAVRWSSSWALGDWNGLCWNRGLIRGIWPAGIFEGVISVGDGWGMSCEEWSVQFLVELVDLLASACEGLSAWVKGIMVWGGRDGSVPCFAATFFRSAICSNWFYWLVLNRKITVLLFWAMIAATAEDYRRDLARFDFIVCARNGWK